MASDLVFHTSDENFSRDVLQSDLPVLVDYWAEWCGPCRMIAPLLDQLAQSHEGKIKIMKLNIDNNRMVPAQYGIRSIPTLMLFKSGEVLATQVGAVSLKELEAFLNQHI